MFKHILAFVGFLLLAQPVSADTPRANLSALELRAFLEGRVVIEMQAEEQTYTSIPKGRVFGYVWRDDGTATVCMAGKHRGKPIGPLELEWRLHDDREAGVTWAMNVKGRKASKRRFIPVYDADAGILELHLRHDGRWIVAKRAWVQASWPRVLRESCPGMTLPTHLSVNEEQTVQAFSKMLLQDRHAVIRNFPGSHLTDTLIRRPFPRSLPHMGEAYADKRFVFHSEGKFSVVDRNGDLVEGPHFDGVWRWTKGRLEMTVRDDPAGPRSIGWRELASDLDMQPTVWTRSTPDRIE